MVVSPVLHRPGLTIGISLRDGCFTTVLFACPPSTADMAYIPRSWCVRTSGLTLEGGVVVDVSRVHVFGDWHGSALWACSLISALPAGSLAVHVGDFGFWPGSSGQRFLADVSDAAVAADVILLVVRGNHDDADFSAACPPADVPGVSTSGFAYAAPNVFVCHGPATAVLSGFSAAFLPGAVSPDRVWRTPGVSFWEDECFTPAQVASLSRADLFFTHESPSSVDMSAFELQGFSIPGDVLEDMVASRELLTDAFTRVRPMLAVHGHWHVGCLARVRTAPSVNDDTALVVGLANEFEVFNHALLDLSGARPQVVFPGAGVRLVDESFLSSRAWRLSSASISSQAFTDLG